MDAVTYSDNAVIDFLNKHFVCLKLHRDEAGADIMEIMKPAKLMWTPTFVFRDHRGTEARRSVGFLPPEEFLPELQFVLGLIDLLNLKPEDAFRRLDTLRTKHPESQVAAEATFWAGIALFRREGRDKNALGVYWQRLRSQFPKSTWWTRADVFDMLK